MMSVSRHAEEKRGQGCAFYGTNDLYKGVEGAVVALDVECAQHCDRVLLVCVFREAVGQDEAPHRPISPSSCKVLPSLVCVCVCGGHIVSEGKAGGARDPKQVVAMSLPWRRL